MIYVFDVEADGFLEGVQNIWHVVFKELNSNITWELTNNGHSSFAAQVYNIIDTADCLIGHNSIDYDIETIRKILGINYDGLVIDTFVLSSLYDPDLLGGHSLDAWGNRLGYPKDNFSDFSKPSEELLSRCVRDVEITEKTYEDLVKKLRIGAPCEIPHVSTGEAWCGVRLGGGS